MTNVTVCPIPKGIPLPDPNKQIQFSFEFPILHSRPSSTKKLCLAMQGYTNPVWGSRTNIVTPIFGGNLDQIKEIWARVAEDFAPFDIDVTTELYPEQNGKVAIIAIGGAYTDWYGSAAGGVAYVGGFYNLSSGVGYVFANSLGNNAKYIAEAASHEAGHLFGLQHQSSWNGSTLVTQYNAGDGNYAPIMGVGYYAAKTLWYKGPTPAGPTSIQDDVAIIAGPYNGFGYVSDDNNDGKPIVIVNNIIDIKGIINNYQDIDKWKFFTAGGAFNATINSVTVGSNLDPIIDLLDSNNNVIYTGKNISTDISPGQYFIVARSNGMIGNQGNYSIAGSINTYDIVNMTVNSSKTLTVSGFDKKGNPTNIESATWIIDENILSINQDNTTCTLTALTPGSTIVTCHVNGKSDTIQVNAS